jgi:DNA-binding Lrp family transcriptional regulator
MKKSRKVQTWRDIYTCLHENGRAHINEICKKIKYTGRGKNRDTISQYLHEAFEKGIITRPRLTLANHEGNTVFGYLVNCKDNRTEFFRQLKSHPEILYIALLNGEYQIFFTAHSRDISLSYQYEVSPIFTPLYTFPEGWNYSEMQCLETIRHLTYEEGMLSRPVLGPLDWSHLDRDIYNIFRMDLRQSLRKVAENLDITYETARLHLYERILPHAIQSIGFFPKGLLNYSHLFFLVKTSCEKSLVAALSKLQTSCLIWPLQNHLICVVYFQHLNLFLNTIFNLEKRKIFKEYYFLLPLEYYETGG